MRSIRSTNTTGTFISFCKLSKRNNLTSIFDVWQVNDGTEFEKKNQTVNQLENDITSGCSMNFFMLAMIMMIMMLSNASTEPNLTQTHIHTFHLIHCNKRIWCDNQQKWYLWLNYCHNWRSLNTFRSINIYAELVHKLIFVGKVTTECTHAIMLMN